jgi:hypothetical protein
MKAGLALATLAVVRLVGSFAMSAIPANSYQGDPAKPAPCFIDGNKDGVCDHAQAGVAGRKLIKDGNASTNRDVLQGGWKMAGWEMKGSKICPSLPDCGNSPSGGVTN